MQFFAISKDEGQSGKSTNLGKQLIQWFCLKPKPDHVLFKDLLGQ